MTSVLAFRPTIPFGIYHVQIILVLAVVGFVEGYDVALGGSLLRLTPEQIIAPAKQ